MNGLDNLAEAYIYTRQYAECVEEAKKIIDIDPTFANVHVHLSQAYLFSGKYDLWIDEWQKLNHLNNDPPVDLALANAVKAEFSRTGFNGAMKRLAQLQEEQSRRILPGSGFRCCHLRHFGGKRPRICLAGQGFLRKESLSSNTSKLIPALIHCVPILVTPLCSSAWACPNEAELIGVNCSMKDSVTA